VSLRRPSGLLIVLVIGLAAVGYVHQCVLRPLVRQYDFEIHLAIARLAVAGVDVYQLDAAAAAELSRRTGVLIPVEVNYPPSYLAFIAPLVAMPPAWAEVVWLLLQNAALVLAVVVLARVTGLRRRGSAGLALVLLLIASAEPVAQSFLYGQVNPILLLLMSVALLDLERGKDARAGFWIAIAAALKVTPAVLLAVPLLRGRSRVLLGAAIAVAVVGASMALVFDHPLDVARDYVMLQSGRGAAGTARDSALNQSAAAFVARLAWVMPGLADAPGWPALSRGLATALAAASLLFGLAMTAVRRVPLRQAYGLVIACVLVASPVSWEHHRLLLLLPALVVAARAIDGPVPDRAGTLLLIGWILIAADLPYDHVALSSGPLALVVSLKLYATIAFAAGLAQLAWADRAPPPVAASASQAEADQDHRP